MIQYEMGNTFYNWYANDHRAMWNLIYSNSIVDNNNSKTKNICSADGKISVYKNEFVLLCVNDNKCFGDEFQNDGSVYICR